MRDVWYRFSVLLQTDLEKNPVFVYVEARAEGLGVSEWIIKLNSRTMFSLIVGKNII